MAVTPLDPGTNVSETIGGKEYGRATLHDANGTDAMGTVSANPAAWSLLGRLKALTDALGLTSSAQRFFNITPGANALTTVPKAVTVATAGTLVVRGDDGGEVTLVFSAGEIKPIKPTHVLSGSATGVVGLA